MALHPVIDESIAGAGIKGENFLFLTHKGDIGNPADVKKRQGTDRDRCGESAMINRNERCAFSAGGDIGGAEIADDGHTKFTRKQRAIAKLNREVLGRAMQDGLTMKADHIDHVSAEPRFEAETLNGGRVPIGEIFLKFPQTARTGAAAGKGFRLFESLEKARPLAALIGVSARAAAFNKIYAVGRDLRDIDPVEGRAAHQAQRSQLVRHSRPSKTIKLVSGFRRNDPC